MYPAGDGVTPGGGTDSEGATAPSGQAGPGVVTSLVLVAFTGLVLAGFVLATAGGAGASAPGVLAQSSGDGGAPTFGNATAVDLTTVELEIKDDSDVNESTIATEDFELSPGNASDVTVSENGSDALATITLAGPIDQDQLRLTVAENGTIADEAGNELTAGDTIGRRIYQMDGVAPSVSDVRVNGNGDAVSVQFVASERLAGITVDLDGPANATMNAGDFSSPAGFHEYDGSISPAASGEYRVTLASVTDRAGNTRDVDHNETARVDVTPPNARASVDYGDSEGDTVTLDASRSTDNGGLASLDWSLGDGTNATGERVTHEYAPGDYTVTLTATDETGNTGTDQILLNLTGDAIRAERSTSVAGADSVSFTGGGPGRRTTMITVDGARANESVTVRRDVGDGTPLAESDAITLEELSVSLTTNASYELGLQAEGPGAVADVAAVTDGEPLGSLTVVHDVGDEQIGDVTFGFGVDRERVDEAIDDPDAVGLYRYHGGDWRELTTRRVDGTNETYRYRASAPGLSRFAVATVPGAVDETADQTETPTSADDAERNRPPVTVTNASVNATDVEPGRPVRVSATLRNGGNATTYTAGLSVDGDVIETQAVQVPANGSAAVSFTHVPESAGSVVVAVDGTTAGTLAVGDGDESMLGFFGVLPLGVLRTLITYVGGVLVALYLVLKAVALYLGY